DVAADIADLSKLGRLDLQERRLRQAREAARDLGLAAACRADHQDVFRQHLFTQFSRQLLASPAVSQRHGDGALGVILADDVAVELGDDLARAERGHKRLLASWPGLAGPSTKRKTWMPGTRPGMTVEETAAGSITKTAFRG